MPRTVLSRVVLPIPFLPSSATISPGPTDSETSFTIETAP